MLKMRLPTVKKAKGLNEVSGLKEKRSGSAQTMDGAGSDAEGEGAICSPVSP